MFLLYCFLHILIGHECETYNNPADFFLDIIYQYEESCKQSSWRRKGPCLSVSSDNREEDVEKVEGIPCIVVAGCMCWVWGGGGVWKEKWGGGGVWKGSEKGEWCA